MSFSISCIYIISNRRLFLLETKEDILVKIGLKIDIGSHFQILVFKMLFNQITLYKNIWIKYVKYYIYIYIYI